MKVAAIQHDIFWEDPAKNIERLRPMIATAKEKGAELIVLPEMFSYGFSMNTQKITEEADGMSATFLMEMAKELGVWIAGSYPEKSNGDPPAFNQLLLAGPDGQVHKYAKIHLFSLGGEDDNYLPGTKPLTLDISDSNNESLSLSAFICYDIRFGNDFWNVAKNTDLYIISANWPEARHAHWETLLRARAVENQAYVIGVNRVGEGDGINCIGGSAIISPLGEILAQAKDREEILIADISSAEVTKTRTKFPFLKDRD